jgi:hypothetical protein
MRIQSEPILPSRTLGQEALTLYEQLDVMNAQLTQVEIYIAEAIDNRKLEDAKSLRHSALDLGKEILHIRNKIAAEETH